MTSSTTASQTELKAARVPLGWRDQCSAYVYSLVAVAARVLNVSNRLLIPLNVCRVEKNYLPWECEHEKHAYEKCVQL